MRLGSLGLVHWFPPRFKPPKEGRKETRLGGEGGRQVSEIKGTPAGLTGCSAGCAVGVGEGEDRRGVLSYCAVHSGLVLLSQSWTDG